MLKIYTSHIGKNGLMVIFAENNEEAWELHRSALLERPELDISYSMDSVGVEVKKGVVYYEST